MTPFAQVTTLEAWKPRYNGLLDFVFVVHPRSYEDLVRPFPQIRLMPRRMVQALSARVAVNIVAGMEARIDGRTVHGELLSVPFAPEDLYTRLPESRAALFSVRSYAESRKVRVMGLGALLPSLARNGALLANSPSPVGVTTGHAYTALAAADFVRRFEQLRGGSDVVAVVGAGGSTGRATTRCLLRDGRPRRLILVDVPARLGVVARQEYLDPGLHTVTAEWSAIRRAPIVLSVTNAPGAILRAQDFAPGCVILDDAQPENVHADVLKERPDLIVVKCLARIPGFSSPFDFGHLDHAPRGTEQEITFPCLAETVMLAAAGHTGHFIVGPPRDEQFDFLEATAIRYGIEPSPFLSFPSVGFVDPQRIAQSAAR